VDRDATKSTAVRLYLLPSTGIRIFIVPSRSGVALAPFEV
jgi:hypothetical protein